MVLLLLYSLCLRTEQIEVPPSATVSDSNAKEFNYTHNYTVDANDGHVPLGTENVTAVGKFVGFLQRRTTQNNNIQNE